MIESNNIMNNNNSSSSSSGDVSLVYSDMSKLIRLKEKELQEVSYTSFFSPLPLELLILILLLSILLLGT